MRLSDRARRIAPSATMAAAGKAKELQRAGVAVVLFDAGEPDFPTPENAKAAAARAIAENVTKYTPLGGILELREAIAGRLREDEGLEYAPSEIVVGNGAKEMCYDLCLALLQAGDEAVVPSPYWVSYVEMIRLADATPVIVETGEDDLFKMSPAMLEAAITPRTRLVFLNSPCNPTGTVYSAEELRALGEVIARHPEIVLLSDEIYKKIAYGPEGRAPSAAAVLRGLRDQVVLVDGASKAYAMTGWRVGFAAGPAPLMAALRNLQSHSTSGTSSISQKAAVAAFGEDQGEVERMRQEFGRRRDRMVVLLNDIDGVRCPLPAGAFYAFPNMEALLGQTYGEHRIETTLQLVDYLLETAHVSTVPGEAFGRPGHLRLSYATSMQQIEEGIRRIDAALTPKAIAL